MLLKELDRQGEVLRNAEKKVDKMEQDMKQTDRHIRSIKSLWGGLVNKFYKAPKEEKSNKTAISSRRFEI